MEANVYHSRSDEELFALLEENDNLALQVLFNRYYKPLCRFAQIYVRDFTFAPEPGQDRFEKGPDQFESDAEQFKTGQDQYQPGPDHFETNQYEFDTNLDEFETNQDEFQTNQDEIQTNQDEFQTGHHQSTDSDQFLTGGDHLQTGQDHLQFQNNRQVLYHQLITEYFDQVITDENLAVLLTWVGRTKANEEEFRETILLLEAIESDHELLVLQGRCTNNIPPSTDQPEVQITVLNEEPLKVKRHFIFLSISASFIALLGIAIILYFHFAAHKLRGNMHRARVVYEQNNTAKMSDTALIKT